MGFPSEIDTHTRVSFDRLLRHQAEQAVTKLRSSVSETTLDGELKMFDRYGTGRLVTRSTRGQANTPQEMPRARRAITPRDFEYTEEFDLQKDPVRLPFESFDLDCSIALSIRRALQRKIDDVIIEGFHADALGGKHGDQRVPYKANPTIDLAAAIAADPFLYASPDVKNLLTGQSIQLTSMRTAVARLAVGMIRRHHIPRSAKIYAAVRYKELDAILFDEDLQFPELIPRAGSIDYNTTRALIDGELTNWLGVTWIHTERIKFGEHGADGVWATFYTHRSNVFGIDPNSFEWEWAKLPGRGKTYQLSIYATMASTRIFELEMFRVDNLDLGF